MEGKQIEGKKMKRIANSIILVFVLLLALTIAAVVTFSIVSTKGKMYEQMTTQGIQLATQIRSDLESDSAVYDAETLTTIGDNPKVISILDYLGTDESVIYTGILDHNNEVIAHSDQNRIGNIYDGTFEDDLVQANQASASMYYDAESGNNALSLLLPIRNGSGEIIGVLALGLSVKAVDAAIQNMIIQSIGIGVIAFLVATLILRIFLSKLLKPIKRLTQTAQLAAQGDFDHQVEDIANNEIGILALAFNGLMSDLKNIISNIVGGIGNADASATALSDIARETKEISDHLSSIIGDVSDGAEHQMSQNKLVNDNMMQMSESLNVIVRELDDFKTVMSDMNRISKQSESDMMVMDQQIKNIALTSKSSGETVNELVRASEEIGKMVDLIDKIAKQTNLIALNAAIEASTAGEHGKGFSVVAEEIRKLATESLKAVEDIGKIVRETQSKRGETIASIQETLDETERGREVGERVKESFTEIHRAIDQASKQFEVLETSSNGLIKSSQEVSCAIESINVISKDVVTKTNEAKSLTLSQNEATNEVLENVENLKELSAVMKQMVDKF